MPKTKREADRLRANARMYEQMAQEATTDSVADLFRYLALECLGAAADAEAGGDLNSDKPRERKKLGSSNENQK
ncbi:MAG: hypothetical protein ACTHLO_15760 [Pseudolabrys sp.]